MSSPPLILSVTMDEASFRFFNALRQQHFPPERNFLDAHLTLFHRLPNEGAIGDFLSDVAQRTVAFPMRIVALMQLGFGVAYRIESPELHQMHRRLQERWHATLSRQDLQPFRPHVTIQNKVEPATAQHLYRMLNASFGPFNVMAIGLSLWTYHGGPWEKVQDFPFIAGNRPAS